MTEIVLTSSVLILILTVLRRLLRGRISPTLQYALWLLVAVRLLIPGTLFPSPVSAVSIANNLYSSITSSEVAQTTPQPQENHQTGEVFPAPPVIDPVMPVVPSPAPSTAPTAASQPINWIDLIWKLGLLITGGVLIGSNLAFYSTLRKTRHRLSPEELPIPCTVPVYQVNTISSPCLFGLRPAIYVNTKAMSEAYFRHILIHEQTHLRHGDHIWALVRCLCLTIHWYNPLVWWAAELARRDCELSCDSAAIRSLGEDQRIRYGETLVAMLSSGRSHMLKAATTMSGSKRTMLERLDLIIHRPHMLRGTLAVVAAVTLGTVLFTFGGYTEKLTEDTGNRITLPVTDNLDHSAQPESPSTESEPSHICYTHHSGLFSLELPESWVTEVTPSESEDGVSFYAQHENDSNNWLISVTPQPADWVEHSDFSMPLASFDTNGTPQTYILSYNGDQSEELSSQIESLAGSFQLLVTPAQFSKLVYHNYRENIALAIAYLPYLNWQDYQDTYGPDELFALLGALYRFADSGTATWDQYHDLLSMTDAGLDGAYAQEFANILQALYQKNEEQFHSVISSAYITDAERERIGSYIDLTSSAETSSPEDIGYSISDGEMMNHIARGYVPSVMQTGSPESLEITLTNDWTLDGIRSALYLAVNEHIRGSILENDLNGIEISYRFRFPEEMRDGITFNVQYYANYKDQDPVTLPSGALHYVGGRTSELTATVHLSGVGKTAPISEEFAAGQAAFDMIATCVSIPISLSVSAEEESYDISTAIRDLLKKELDAVGLSDCCHLSSLSFGSYYNPVWCDPGYEQTVDFIVSVDYSNGTTIQHFAFPSTLILRTIE